jgi:hypothetical protein
MQKRHETGSWKIQLDLVGKRVTLFGLTLNWKTTSKFVER